MSAATATRNGGGGDGGAPPPPPPPTNEPRWDSTPAGPNVDGQPRTPPNNPLPPDVRPNHQGGSHFPQTYDWPLTMNESNSGNTIDQVQAQVEIINKAYNYSAETGSFALGDFAQLRGAWGITLDNLTATAGSATPKQVATYNGYTTYRNVQVTMRCDSTALSVRYALARWNASANTGYAARAEGGGMLKIQRFDGGASVILASFAQAYTTANEITLRCFGNSISLLLDGAVIGSVTDATYDREGLAGLGASGTDPIFHALEIAPA